MFTGAFYSSILQAIIETCQFMYNQETQNLLRVRRLADRSNVANEFPNPDIYTNDDPWTFHAICCQSGRVTGA
jgi:hypothetical protein